MTAVVSAVVVGAVVVAVVAVVVAAVVVDAPAIVLAGAMVVPVAVPATVPVSVAMAAAVPCRPRTLSVNPPISTTHRRTWFRHTRAIGRLHLNWSRVVRRRWRRRARGRVAGVVSRVVRGWSAEANRRRSSSLWIEWVGGCW